MSETEQAMSVLCDSSALMPGLPIRQSDPASFSIAVQVSKSKRAFDIIGASILILFAAPTFLLVTLFILCGGGAVFYAHHRVGLGGRSFRCLKFCTMVPNGDQVLAATLAEDAIARAEWETKRKLVNDPRVTRIGRVLRKTSLDELPQLINVVKGDMSLVGPRPIVEAEQTKYGDALTYYLAARPGITGLWQVSGRSKTSFEQRVALDRSYVEGWTLRNDFLILLHTIPALFDRGGAY